jgi:hypothetical protein
MPRLPDIWWTCACNTLDDMDNELVVYVDVLAGTKDEAYAEAERRMTVRGLLLVSASVLATPERKVPVSHQRALPAPPPRVEPEEFFPVAFFTKYDDHTVCVNQKESVYD